MNSGTAQRIGNVEMVGMLIPAGANPNARGSHRMTPLHYVAAMTDEWRDVLPKAQASTWGEAAKVESPFANYDPVATVDALVDGGADVEARGEYMICAQLHILCPSPLTTNGPGLSRTYVPSLISEHSERRAVYYTRTELHQTSSATSSSASGSK